MIRRDAVVRRGVSFSPSAGCHLLKTFPATRRKALGRGDGGSLDVSLDVGGACDLALAGLIGDGWP